MNDIVNQANAAVAAAIAQAADVGEQPVTSVSHLPTVPDQHVYFLTGLWHGITQYLGQLPRTISKDFFKASAAVFGNNGIDLSNPNALQSAPSHVSVNANVLTNVLQFVAQRPAAEVDNLMDHVEQHVDQLAAEAKAVLEWTHKKNAAAQAVADAQAAADASLAAIAAATAQATPVAEAPADVTDVVAKPIEEASAPSAAQVDHAIPASQQIGDNPYLPPVDAAPVATTEPATPDATEVAAPAAQ